MVTVEKADPKEFDALESARPAKPIDEWKLEALDLLQKGNDVKVRFSDSKERRAHRLALARLASARLGLRTQSRDGRDDRGEFFIVRRAGGVEPSTAPRPRQPRKRRSQADEA